MQQFLSSSHLRRRSLLALAATILGLTAAAHAISCTNATAHTPSEAEQAYLKADYDRAATLYQQQLTQKPNDPTLTAHLVEILLRVQKPTEADTLVHKAIAKYPNSATLDTTLGEVQYREGQPWLAGDSAIAALKLDPCYPRAHLLESILLEITSNHASSARQIALAHTLDPYDPLIRLIWLNHQPLDQRIAGLQAYIAADTGNGPDDLKNLKSQLEQLQEAASGQHKACSLVSKSDKASIPFADILRDAAHVRSYGLQVNFNDYPSVLQIDTASGGIVISRTIAEHAGLKRLQETHISGIGDEASTAAYTAYAENIKIGSLEFHDCTVQVVDKGNVLGNDGVIGSNVFSRFLVTLDYPGHKLLLGPLPKRPDDTAPLQSALETSDSSNSDTSASNAPPAQPNAAKPHPPALQNRYIAPEMQDWTSVYRIGQNLIVPVSLNDTPLRLFILATGSDTTTITPDAARQLTNVRLEEDLKVRGLSGNVAKVYVADQITFKFANISQINHNVSTFDTPGVSKNMGMEISGLIGISALGHMSISIDYRDGLIKLIYDSNRDWKYPK